MVVCSNTNNLCDVSIAIPHDTFRMIVSDTVRFLANIITVDADGSVFFPI